MERTPENDRFVYARTQLSTFVLLAPIYALVLPSTKSAMSLNWYQWTLLLISASSGVIALGFIFFRKYSNYIEGKFIKLEISGNKILTGVILIITVMWVPLVLSLTSLPLTAKIIISYIIVFLLTAIGIILATKFIAKKLPEDFKLEDYLMDK